MGEPRPFNRERFLLYMLGAIFAFQAVIFGLGLFWCARGGGLKSCPRIGERYEATFNVMIATTLALLTGAGLQAMSQARPSSGDGGVSLPAPPQLPPEGPQGPRSPARGRKSQQASEE